MLLVASAVLDYMRVNLIRRSDAEVIVELATMDSYQGQSMQRVCRQAVWHTGQSWHCPFIYQSPTAKL